ncbi:MAG: 3-phosphoshikimate 1-carboxyvinyltransferase [Alphaproteobacteria bacterium]|nr:3-phosphoshikimate 1-carboxyvinyltransferase [Alphaproteobacteria bacterium]
MSNNEIKTPFVSSKASGINGPTPIPGDKSISHRALMFGGLAIGETKIEGLLEGEDVIRTADAMRSMGAIIKKHDDGSWTCNGVGIGGLREPENVLDMGNSGTSTRLLMGLIGGHPITATFTGDASLTKRPMNRVIKPLSQMGIEVSSREGGKLPLTTKGPQTVQPIEYRLPVASAQVKSAVMLSGLSAPGKTTVIEEKPTRDHTENMLRHFGVRVESEKLDDGSDAISVYGQQDLKAANINVPSDPSSAAFPTVAALINENSEITLNNILMNDRRNGLYTTLIEMGADITVTNERTEGGEPVCDMVVTGKNKLKGITVPEDRVPSMIDEFPILAVAASLAEGTTYMSGLEELRVKESDRLLMMYQGLKACGVDLEMGEDTLTIHGNGTPPKGGTKVETALDHRIAMSFLILGTVSEEPITIDDVAPIQTSFPNFVDLLNGLGADLKAA